MNALTITPETPIAREPTADEIDDLIVWVWTGRGHNFPCPLPNDEFGQVIKDVSNAYINVYENCWLRSGYVNRVMTVDWGDDEDQSEPSAVFIWYRATLTFVDHGEPFWQIENRLWQILVKLSYQLNHELIPKAKHFIHSLFSVQQPDPL